ncbi:MAG: hypothetical protein AAGH78_11955 [Cyanobacteria bacterium P01_H01_bin.58]
MKELSCRDNWHGLELESDWLKKVMVDFACTATSATRSTPLRLKESLHLSLAYNFQPDQAEDLELLAHELVDPTANVQWELRFYQRNPDNRWLCHQSIKMKKAKEKVG